MFKKNKPFFIAEISANHNGNLNIAKRLISCAKENGADAVKLQTYDAESMTINSKKKYFKIEDGIWKNFYLWDLYSKAKTPYEWHRTLFSFAKKRRIKIFSTPFSEKDVDFLEKLNCPFYKVSSFEMNDLNLIRKIAQTRKPIIISTGVSNLNEIEMAYKTAKRYGSKKIILLYCVSNYPSKLDDFNLKNIKILKDKFKCEVGLSDHSIDNRVGISAAAFGATVFEKHIALKNQKRGFDLKFSLKGDEIKKYIEDINVSFNLIGKNFFFRSKNEMKNKKFCRSIFSKKKIKKGEKFSTENIIKIRPGNGISPKYFNKLLKKRSPLNIDKESPIPSKIISILKLN
ncbi:pseudaminic acid synthase [Candidatus Pelagibacter sp.]|nr:pseudaminic acid synthase [Candidatus Pelagibacter sp.]